MAIDGDPAAEKKTFIEDVIDDLKDLVGLGDDDEPGADPAESLDTDIPNLSTTTQVGVSESVGDVIGSGPSGAVQGGFDVTTDSRGNVDIAGGADVGVVGPGGSWGEADVAVHEDGTVEITDVDGDLGGLGDLGDLEIDRPEGYVDDGRVWADDDGLHGEYEFGNPRAAEGEPTYSGRLAGTVNEDGLVGTGHGEAAWAGDIAGVRVGADANADAGVDIGADGASAYGRGEATVKAGGLELGAAEGEFGASVGGGDVDLAGNADATWRNPAFGGVQETYDAEVAAHADGQGAEWGGDVGYEADVPGMGGGPEINLSLGGRGSVDYQDSADDVQGTVQDTYDAAEDTVSNAGESLSNSDANPSNW